MCVCVCVWCVCVCVCGVCGSSGRRLSTTNRSGVKQSDPTLHPHEDKEKNGMDGVVCVRVCGVRVCVCLWCVFGVYGE